MVQNFEVFLGMILVKNLTICACQIFHKLSTIRVGGGGVGGRANEIVKILTISRQK